jgi:hypothetical protein
MPKIAPESATPSAFDLLARFTALRQSGTNRDEAWYQVCDSAGDLPGVTYKAFLSLAKNWERREGHKYHYRSQSEKDSTMSGKSEKGAAPAQRPETQEVPPPTPQQIKVPPAKPAGPALTGTLDPAQLRQQEQQRLEQMLDQLDDLDDDELKPRVLQKKLGRGQPVARGQTTPMNYARDFFGPRTLLLMYFKNSPQPLRVTIAGDAELFIGRATANAAMSPEIDLTPVNAGEYGVSRMHAAITRRNNQLLITDLESMNFTHVNGIRLLPNEVRVLQDGDEIWFAQLRCQIRFQHG